MRKNRRHPRPPETATETQIHRQLARVGAQLGTQLTADERRQWAAQLAEAARHLRTSLFFEIVIQLTRQRGGELDPAAAAAFVDWREFDQFEARAAAFIDGLARTAERRGDPPSAAARRSQTR